MADQKMARMGINNRLRSTYSKGGKQRPAPRSKFSESATCYMHRLISGTAAGNDYRF